MIYMVRIERALEGSNIGFTLRYEQAGSLKEHQRKGLFYADDVLFADKLGDMHRLADICGQEGEALGFRLSGKKSSLMAFNDGNDQAVFIQGHELPRVREYKYLGVCVNKGNRYLEVQEKTIGTGKRNAAITNTGRYGDKIGTRCFGAYGRLIFPPQGEISVAGCNEL